MENPNPKAKADIPRAWMKTLEQRIHQSPLNQPLEKDSIVFPYSTMMGLDPFAQSAGKTAVETPDVDKMVWRVCPQTDGYLKYLAERPGFIKANKTQELIDWCVRNKLDLAAEYELRRMLFQIGRPMDAEYKKYLRQWLAYADKRQIQESFALPVKGEWYVIVDKTKHHRVKHWAAHAFDIVIHKDGKPYKGNGRNLTDHYCWGQPVSAQADGIVISVTDKHPDMPVGQAGDYYKANQVMVYYGGGIVGNYGHLQNGSARVKVGDHVKVGDVLGLVGNSGASGSPHLHFDLGDCAGFALRGRFTYKLRKGRELIETDGGNLVEGTYVQDWTP